MKPRLVCISDKGQSEIYLDQGALTIGRDVSNSIRLEESIVSSHHCRIERDEERFVLTDSESTNGTFLNGKTITRTPLQHGDQIRVGGTTFYFYIGDPSDRHERQVHIDDVEDTGVISSDTVCLKPEDLAYLGSSFSNDPSFLKRMAHDMSVLLRLSAELNEADDSVRLQEVLLQRVFEILPADQGVVLLGFDIESLFKGQPVSRLRLETATTIRVSRTISQQVFSSGEALLRNDLFAQGAVSESIAEARLRSVLCVPLSVMGSRIGVLYFAATRQGSVFDRRHLELVAAIGGIAALAIEHIRYAEWLETENRQLTNEANSQHNMVGDSPVMQKVYESISLVAPTDSPVLILGESGTGKELAARAIHNNSKHRNGSFVVVNCGAIAETLFASELFGHVKGAFTGADRDKKGFIEEADGGTLFLDELGELPLHCQAALLRVLEEGQFVRVGSTRPISVDIRIISATNRPLNEQIQNGGFRADLYYRMGLPLEMPPLRDRIDDIPLLVRFFLQKHRNQVQRDIGATPPETIRALQAHNWPGNVRELASAVLWGMVFGKSERIQPKDLPPQILKRERTPGSSGGRLDEAMESFERQFILKALQETRGNVVEAASLLARAPNYLQRRVSQLKLRDELERIRGKL